MFHSNENSMRRVSLAAVLAGIISLPATAHAQSGSARAAYVSTSTINSSIASAVLPSGGGMTTAETPAVGIAGLLGAGVGSAVTSGTASTDRLGVQSTSSLADVNILAGKVRASSVIATVRVLRNGTTVVADGLGSSITGLVINGVSYDADAMAPNSRVDLPGVGYVMLNELVQGATSVTVNMIRVVLTAPLTGIKTGEIVVGSASGSTAP
jgi:hypothetical protein